MVTFENSAESEGLGIFIYFSPRSLQDEYHFSLNNFDFLINGLSLSFL